MNKTSSVITGSATVAAAAISPLVDWLANGIMKLAMPAQVVLIISAALITVGHFAANLINAKFPIAPGVADAPTAPTRVTSQSGFARVGMLTILALTSAAGLLLSGCAAPAGAANQTPRQIATQVCPAAQTAASSLLALRELDADARSELVTAATIVDAVCTGAETVDPVNLMRLADTALPALIRIADSAPLDPGEHDQVILGLTIGQIVLTGVLQAAQPVTP